MSDINPQPTPPPTPVAKTSAVPLKKETVRITLRARPGAGVTQPRESTGQVPTPGTGSVNIAPASRATSPIQLPSGPLPPPAARPSTSPVQLAPAPATFPPAPSAPRPPVPTVAGGPPRAPGAPPAPGGVRPPLPAATVPLAKAPSARPVVPPGAKVEAGATTVALSQKPVIAKPGGAGTGTAPMVKTQGSVGDTTSQLPKATVKLQQTVGLAQAPQIAAQPAAAAAAKPAGAEEVYEEKNPEAGLVPLSVLCTILAVVLTVLSLFSNDKLQMWSENSALMAPPPNDPKWEQRLPDGTYVSKFSETLRNITKSVTP